MTEDDQNLAIDKVRFPNQDKLWYLGHLSDIDYTDDLNACHEMEKVLTAVNQESIYRDRLQSACMRDWLANKSAYPFSEYATAAQRAEAFLKTLGLWVDG